MERTDRDADASEELGDESVRKRKRCTERDNDESLQETSEMSKTKLDVLGENEWSVHKRLKMNNGKEDPILPAHTSNDVKSSASPGKSEVSKAEVEDRAESEQTENKRPEAEKDKENPVLPAHSKDVKSSASTEPPQVSESQVEVHDESEKPESKPRKAYKDKENPVVTSIESPEASEVSKAKVGVDYESEEPESTRRKADNDKDDPIFPAHTSNDEQSSASPETSEASKAKVEIRNESEKPESKRRKSDKDKENPVLPVRPTKDEKKNESPELNYISFLNIALQRHKDKLCDLSFQEIVRTGNADSKARFGTRCKINLRKPDGNIERLLEADGWHSQRKKSKHKACEQMIMKLKGIIENLSYRPGHNSSEKKEPPLPEGKKKNVSILEALKGKGIVTEGPKYDFQAVDLDQEADKDNFNYGQKVWRTTCTVKLRHWHEFIVCVGQHRKKNDSKHDAANKVVEEIRTYSTPEIDEFMDKHSGKPKKPDSNEDEAEQGRDEEETITRKVRHPVQLKQTLLDKISEAQGDDFQLPDEYKITVASSQDLCQQWHRETLEPDGDDVGVYIESKSMHDMLQATADMDRKGADVVALATTRGALLCVRPDGAGDEEWPPSIIRELLFDIAYPKVALLPPEILSGIIDLQQYVYALAHETVERVSPGSVHIPLEKMVSAFLNKTLGDLYNEDNHQLDVRYRPALKVATASLAVYTQVKRQTDAKIRSETEVASMAGFLDLAEKLMGITPLAR